MTHEEIYQRYLYAGALTRDADALAELFAPDGVVESPLVPEGHEYPRRLEGREQIRAGMAAYYQRAAIGGETPGAGEAAGGPAAPGSEAVDTGESRYVLHATGDPDVFIAEVDAVVGGSDGNSTVSLVQIFRVREGQITLLRDYFSPAIVG
jgi:ketosteroid isomerase-like protein